MCNFQGRTKVFRLFLCGVAAFLGASGLWAWRVLAQCDPITGASGPDAVSNLNPNAGEVGVFGRVNDIQAYFAEGGVCNVGTEPLPGDLSTNQHAMMTQNLYRLSNSGNRFEQIGISWVKHDDWTSTGEGSTCGSIFPCDQEPGMVGVGCSDVYVACTNGGQYQLGARSQINPASGAWPTYGTIEDRCNASGSTIACRLQVKADDFADGLYFLEQQVITPDETSQSTRNNNVSYMGVSAGSCSSAACTCTRGAPGCPTTDFCTDPNRCTSSSCIHPLTVTAASSCQLAAIYAWKDSESACTGNENCVKETAIQVSGDGRFILAAKAVPSTPTGFWSYEYALYNMNSEQGAVSFVIPLMEDTCAVVSTNSFHDLDYHDGDGVGCQGTGCVCSGGTNNGESCGDPADCPDPTGKCSGGTRLNFDGTPWPATVTEASVSWATTPYSQKQNANALRWGTLYNFRFRANRAPTAGNATIGLFKSGGTEQAETLRPWGEQGPISCDY